MPCIRHVINGTGAALVALLCFAMPAAASGAIVCNASDGSDASIDIEIGHLSVLTMLGATATDGIAVWSTHDIENARPMILGQGFMDDRQVLIDFIDPNFLSAVVSLRLFQMSGVKSYAEAGVLSFAGGAVFPVRCDNG